MSAIAVDVVLFPDQPMAGRTIGISRKLSRNNNDKIVLNDSSSLPHISLAMGAVDLSSIDEITTILSDIAAARQTLCLKIRAFCTNVISTGETISEFSIENAPDIQSLHETVMSRLRTFFSYNISADMLLSPPAIEDFSLFWIRNYPKNSSLKNFSPHITLGFGTLQNVQFPPSFHASTLALCHLGNYCTCRKVLYSWPFKG
jgi:2'-5' RNA ligase